MPKYFIEVPHGADPVTCARVIQVFLQSGSHFLTHADWGCKDGDHKAWFTMDADNREEARNVVPPMLRHDAKVVELCTFTLEQVDAMLRQHTAK